MTKASPQTALSTPTPQATANAALDRIAVTLVIVAGIVSALHVGKGPIALPEMQREFGRSLAELSGMLSVFAIVGVLGGMAAGALAQRMGDRRVLMSGLIILGLASLAGAAAPSYAWLIVTRIVEGLGFLMVVVAAPAALNRLTPPTKRSIVFGFWGTFMGIGIALSMLLGPLLNGWQGLWLLDGALALVVAMCVGLRVPAAPGARKDAGQDVGSVLRSRPTWLLALAFAVYNLQFFAMMSFLPSFLMQRVGLSMAQAGTASAMIVLANAAGNVLGGLCLQRGMGSTRLMALGYLIGGLLGVLAFLPATPEPAVLALCVAFSVAAGVLPATFLTSAPRSAPAPHLAPMSLGLVMQGNYLGQVVAPMQTGALFAVFGWIAVGAQIGMAALAGIALVWRYRKLCTRPRPAQLHASPYPDPIEGEKR
ncbi:CynX/NimT family MFS transporter [Pseudomonas aeruginosa]